MLDMEDEELSYTDILANLAVHGELIITIPAELETQVKIGLKNAKARAIAKARKEGKDVPDEVLEFYSRPSKQFENCIDLQIVLERRGVVKVKAIRIPDNTI